MYGEVSKCSGFSKYTVVRLGRRILPRLKVGQLGNHGSQRTDSTEYSYAVQHQHTTGRLEVEYCVAAAQFSGQVLALAFGFCDGASGLFT